MLTTSDTILKVSNEDGKLPYKKLTSGRNINSSTLDSSILRSSDLTEPKLIDPNQVSVISVGSKGSSEEESKMVKSNKAPPKKRNLNVEAAYLHILGDVLNSVGVIIASSLIYFDERLWYLDPICTLFFACIVFYTTRITFYQCCAILMEATPDEFDTDEITKSLEKIEGVGLVHDVHLWSLSSGKHAFICHIELALEFVDASQEVLMKADELLRQKYKLNHLTIQIEKPS
jgi:zinc transporter 2